MSNCHSTGSVIGGDDSRYLGGLSGCNGDSSSISNCYSIGSANSGEDSYYLGGLCGYNGGPIDYCYSTVSVSVGDNSRYLGGLCGLNFGSISNSYAMGFLAGGDYIGGLCGGNFEATINNCYSTGLVTAGNDSGYIGGLFGRNYGGVISASLWDIDTSGMTYSDGGTGKTTLEMLMLNTYSDHGWDFSDTDVNPAQWQFILGYYPILYWENYLDSDNDGLWNKYENDFGLDPNDSDTDGDGLSDYEEVAYDVSAIYYNPYDPNTGTGTDLNAKSKDTDADGLEDFAEINTYGTNPISADTDGDGMSDGYERTYGLNPLQDDTASDLDGDGVANINEHIWGLNPNSTDTDSDGLTDDFEVCYDGNCDNYNPYQLGSGGSDLNANSTDTDADGVEDFAEVNTHGTNPISADTDYDGMPDGWELIHSFNPLQNDAQGDADSDGLSNVNEYLYGCKPSNIDSDDDGMPDGWEVDNGLNPVQNDSQADVDGDGLTNFDEYSYGCNPRNSDTDYDGMSDAYEVNNGLNPLANDRDGDADNDGLSNYCEYLRGSLPNDNSSVPTPIVAEVLSDSYSIQQAIDSLPEPAGIIEGDSIIVHPGIYYENINFRGKNITVTSLDPNDLNTLETTIINGGQNGTVVTFNYNEKNSCVLTGFTITNGNYYEGGGVLCSYGASPTITKNIITLNSADYGGGIRCYNSKATISNNTIKLNSANYSGGGIDCDSSSVLIANNVISDNSANENGGGIRCKGALPVITGNEITDNSAAQNGGGISCWGTSAEITDNVIEDNVATNNGGGVYGLKSSPAITDCIIEDNTATYGGGSYLEKQRGVTEKTKLTSSDGVGYDYFGCSVAMDGNNVLIGASSAKNDSGSSTGSAYLFNLTTGEQFAKLTASDGYDYDNFGCSVAIDGNLAIVGMRGDDDAGYDSGSVYLFDVTTGTQLAKLTASDGDDYDNFGGSVAIDGNIAIVGAHGNNNYRGSAYLFDLTTGTQLAKLTASDGYDYDYFGCSVAIDGDVAIVGMYGDDDAGYDSGSVYLFDVTTGTQLAKLTASDGYNYSNFGCSIAIDGNIAIVGAYGDNNYRGSVYLFDVTTGTQLAKLSDLDGVDYDYFGYSVAMDGNIVVIGASSGKDDTGNSTGSTYLFDLTTGEQLVKFTASDGRAYDNFGGSVAIDGNNVVVGATYGSNDAGDSSGVAYTFQGITKSEPKLINCIVTKNSAAEGGGIKVLDGSASVINSTLTANIADSNGGGINVENSDLLIGNSILWENTAASGDAVYLCENSVVTINYSDAEGGETGIYDPCEGVMWGNGNIDEDPLFVAPDSNDLHLLPDSSCIDAGDPCSLWENEPWPNGARVNIGAYGNTIEATRSRAGLDFSGFDIIEKTRVGRTTFRYVLSLSLTNITDSDITDVTVKLIDVDAQVISVVDDEMFFPVIASGNTSDSDIYGDYFTIDVDRSAPITSGRLTWQVDYIEIEGSTSMQMMSLGLPAALGEEIAGDITGEGDVDIADLKRLTEKWLWIGTPGSIDEDIAPQPDGDGIVNFLDFALLAENWMK